jgi:hypothetical protein
VERAIAITPEDQTLGQAHAELVERFTTGVGAYEQLVGAAAGYVAQDGQVSGEAGAIQRLIDATDLLRGTADGLSELKSATDPPS